MATRSQDNWIGRWVIAGLLLALGGMAYVYATLWVAQVLIPLITEGRILPQVNEGSFALIVACAALVGLVAMPIIALFSRGRLGCGGALLIVLVWMVSYLGLWGTSQVTRSPVGIPVLAGWSALAGGLCGLVVARLRPRGSKRRQGRSLSQEVAAPRPDEPVVRADQFGRVPAATVVLVNRLVHQARNRVVSALPSGASAAVRSTTVSAILDRTLKDWWDNGNQQGLTTTDIDDLRSFVQLAAHLSGPQGLSSAEGLAVYRATLGALLDDWLEHWNDNGVDGPPQR